MLWDTPFSSRYCILKNKYAWTGPVMGLGTRLMKEWERENAELKKRQADSLLRNRARRRETQKNSKAGTPARFLLPFGKPLHQ
jgi:hypothetical protein